MNFIVFDLEATCIKEKDPKFVNEIIEIGAVKLDKNLNTLDTFSKFVQPSINPILTPFCTALTTIAQKDVEGSNRFGLTMKDFESWVGDYTPTFFVSWGRYDKAQILRESNVKRYTGRIIKMLNNHINLKQQFADIYNCKPCGMLKALNKLNILPEGIHHRGYWDAINISKILKTIIDYVSFDNVCMDCNSRVREGLLFSTEQKKWLCDYCYSK